MRCMVHSRPGDAPAPPGKLPLRPFQPLLHPPTDVLPLDGRHSDGDQSDQLTALGRVLGVIQFSECQQSGVGGDGGTM